MKHRALLAAAAAAAIAIASAQDEPSTDFGPLLREFSLQQPYLHDEFNNLYWDFGGTTFVKVFDFVRLTSDARSQQGWIYTKQPLLANYWVIEFSFRIHGSHGMAGDGLAFWFTEDMFKPGHAFGRAERFKGLGVFFDTYANSKHEHSFPYVSSMINDGTKEYDHDHDNKASLAGHGCEANIRGTEKPLRARLSYFKNKVLELEISDDGEKGWQPCFILSKVELPAAGYLGFTAQTGDLHDNHDVTEVLTYTQLPHPVYTKNDASDSKLSDDSANRIAAPGKQALTGWRAWLWSLAVFTFKLIVAGAVLGAAFYAYREFAAQRSNTKRF